MRKGQHLSQETKDKIRAKLKGKRYGFSGEYKKGATPWNKGTVGLMKANKTSFKKGQKPSNYMGGYKMCKDGIYVRCGNKTYKYGKLKVGKYESLARHNWKEKFGEIPKGMIIWHKDGDIYNNEIENLEIITRAENIGRNKQQKVICSICGTEFLSKSGRSKTCSEKCHKEYCQILNQEWQENHRDKMRESRKRYKDKMRKLLLLTNTKSKPISINTYDNTNNSN